MENQIYVDRGRLKCIQQGQQGHSFSSDSSYSLMFQIDAALEGPGAEPRLPVVSGLAPVICKYESVMDSRRGSWGIRG